MSHILTSVSWREQKLAVFKREFVFMEVHSLGSKANIGRQVMLFPPAHRVPRVKRDLAQGWTPTIRGPTTDGLTQNLCADAKIWKCQNKIKQVSWGKWKNTCENGNIEFKSMSMGEKKVLSAVSGEKRSYMRTLEWTTKNGFNFIS